MLPRAAALPRSTSSTRTAGRSPRISSPATGRWCSSASRSARTSARPRLRRSRRPSAQLADLPAAARTARAARQRGSGARHAGAPRGRTCGSSIPRSWARPARSRRRPRRPQRSACPTPRSPMPEGGYTHRPRLGRCSWSGPSGGLVAYLSGAARRCADRARLPRHRSHGRGHGRDAFRPTRPAPPTAPSPCCRNCCRSTCCRAPCTASRAARARGCATRSIRARCCGPTRRSTWARPPNPDPFAYPSFNAFFTRALRPGRAAARRRRA